MLGITYCVEFKIRDHPSGYFLKMLFIFICITPKKASLNIPVDIFDVPAVRSVNMIGTSVTLSHA